MCTGGRLMFWVGGLSAAAMLAGCEVVVVEECHPPTHLYGGAKLFDAGGPKESRSGWDFSAVERVPWEHPDTDMFFWISEGVPLLAVPDYETDIQDAGFREMHEVEWAPEDGWSFSGTVEAIPGHIYVVWTRDGHFAKFRVLSVSEYGVEFDWVYALDEGNPVLRPVHGLAGTPARTGPRPHMALIKKSTNTEK